MNTPNKQAELEKEIYLIKRYRNLKKKGENTGEAIIRATEENMKLPLLKAELKGIKEGKTQAISEFKEKLKKAIEGFNLNYYDCEISYDGEYGSFENWAYREKVRIQEIIDKTAQEILG